MAVSVDRACCSDVRCLTVATDSPSESVSRSIRRSIEHVYDVRAGVRTNTSPRPNKCSNGSTSVARRPEADAPLGDPGANAPTRRTPVGKLRRLGVLAVDPRWIARRPWAANSFVARFATDGARAEPADQSPAPARQARTTRRLPSSATASSATSSTVRIRPPECTSRLPSPPGVLRRRASRSARRRGTARAPGPARRLGVDRHRHRDDRGLGGGVHAVAGHRPEPGERRGVDDVAAAPVAERRDRGAHPPQRAEQVHLDQAAYRLLGQVRRACRRRRRRRC